MNECRCDTVIPVGVEAVLSKWLARKLSHVTEKVSTKSNLQLNIDEVDNNTLWKWSLLVFCYKLFFFSSS